MRSIKALSKDENNNIEYSYNANGVRISKEVTINGITTNVEYVLNGTNIIEETRTTGSVTEILKYHYDSNNSIIGFTYNGEKYLYLKNIQQDITGIIDENNNLVVEYNYDGYGNIISMVDNTTNKIGEKNPYRYRSYYYDSETSWYYLNSRYYNPNIGRFITMDEIEYLGVTSTILSYNLFTYCEGNPVIYGDGDGNARELLINQPSSNVFSRSSGEDFGDIFYINAPKIPVASTTIIIQAKLVVIPFVVKIFKNLNNWFAKDKKEEEKDIPNIDDESNNNIIREVMPPATNFSNIPSNPFLTFDRSQLYVTNAQYITMLPMTAANKSIDNYMLKGLGMMRGSDRDIVETMFDDWWRSFF